MATTIKTIYEHRFPGTDAVKLSTRFCERMFGTALNLHEYWIYAFAYLEQCYRNPLVMRNTKELELALKYYASRKDCVKPLEDDLHQD